MKDRYVEITFRKGKALAAYVYLPRPTGVKSAWTEEAGPGMLVDYSADGTPIGIEITALSHMTANALNAILEKLGLDAMEPEELAPLRAA